uniref:Uncharacterized protein n=1 Tax=Glossina austeni TaxID=7395 RepID=A0A1A9V6V5_GLOAU
MHVSLGFFCKGATIRIPFEVIITGSLGLKTWGPKRTTSQDNTAVNGSLQSLRSDRLKLQKSIILKKKHKKMESQDHPVKIIVSLVEKRLARTHNVNFA